MTQPSLNCFVSEIEATPGEHWAEILSQLRQFRENVTKRQPLIADAQQLQTSQAVIALLHNWVEEGSTQEYTQVWKTLKTNLDADSPSVTLYERLSDRPLFPLMVPSQSESISRRLDPNFGVHFMGLNVGL